jgi:hypothetical protein
MTTDKLDPLIHVPTRLRIVATLAALPDGLDTSGRPAEVPRESAAEGPATPSPIGRGSVV